MVLLVITPVGIFFRTYPELHLVIRLLHIIVLKLVEVTQEQSLRTQDRKWMLCIIGGRMTHSRRRGGDDGRRRYRRGYNLTVLIVNSCTLVVPFFVSRCFWGTTLQVINTSTVLPLLQLCLTVSRHPSCKVLFLTSRYSPYHQYGKTSVQVQRDDL